MNVLENFQYFFDIYGDPRVEGWFLMSSPLPTVFICLAYVLLVTKIGPKLMKHREPFKLRKTIIFYNFLQVLLSAYLFYEACMFGWLTFYSYRCQPVDYSNNPVALRTVRACYLYYLSKFFEFLDTVFFVLRKNNYQITELHVIHHGVMPITWFGVKFCPGGHLTFFGFLNTFVHIIMYSYYMIAALGPQYKKYLSWKKYLTLLQMLQFIAVVIHTAQLLIFDCNYSKPSLYMVFGLAIIFFCLFHKFYNGSYGKGEKRSEKKGDSIINENALMGMCFPGGLQDDNDTKLE